jgi:hypothetical protein
MILDINPINEIIHKDNIIYLYSTYDTHSTYGFPQITNNFNSIGGFIFNKNNDNPVIVEKFKLMDMRIAANMSCTIQNIFFEIAINPDINSNKIFNGTTLTPHLVFDEFGVTLYIDVDTTDIALIRKIKIKKIKSKIKPNDI